MESTSTTNCESIKQNQAINMLFRKLKAAFPQRYKSVFPTIDEENTSKKQWRKSLNRYSPERIVKATEQAIRQAKYFPDLIDIQNHCKLTYKECGLPSAEAAYREACFATDQSAEASWTHPAVYLAARATGWLLLRTEEQRIVFPVFQRNYGILCNRVIDGEDLAADLPKGLEHHQLSAAEQAEQQSNQHLKQQMQAQGINPKSGRQAFEHLKQQLQK
ncbi:replication protein P [Spartinivicinus poritis]|uniref:Replication protein P n=1 Tax=Spartinivicinus poritis TaxID=2994640 RepID=A0ABT5U2F5_9GAMM|nr:replication protein P [Spartinivicinus sp. A2-2]MDE1460410.1 replication protein P [Spartinivicinus sp. A2-2]